MDTSDFDLFDEIFDEERIKRLFDEMVEEFKKTDKQQESLKRDHKRQKLIELTPESQLFVDLRYLASHAN